jgi:hypothetical protein
MAWAFLLLVGLIVAGVVRLKSPGGRQGCHLRVAKASWGLTMSLVMV